jgi:hypothetical protein
MPLRPALSSDLRHLRFSSDGRYILAQDDTGITVLSAQPFQVLYRAPAENADPAEFVPEYADFVFLSSGTHVERWSVASRSLVSSIEIPLRAACVTRRLAPDGKTLGCVDEAGTLRLIDVATGESLLEKKDFASALILRTTLDFSPDARYLLATGRGLRGTTFIWGLREKAAIPLRGELKKQDDAHLAFLAPDRLLASPRVAADKSGTNVTATLLSFPAGEVLANPVIAPGPVYRAADPAYAIVRPLGKFASGAIQLATGQTITNRAPALDVFGQTYVAERLLGELALYQRGQESPATATLPEAEWSALRAVAVAPDFGWLAVSTQARASLWNLRTAQSVARFRAFDGGYFDPQGQLLMDAPTQDITPRRIVDINLARLGSTAGPEVKEPVTTQVGPYLVTVRGNDGTPPVYVAELNTFQNVTYSIRDARTLKPLWSRRFNGETPRVFYSDSGLQAVLLHNARTELASRDPAVKKLLAEERLDERVCIMADLYRTVQVALPDTPQVTFPMRNKWYQVRPGIYLAETIDLATGDTITRTVVDIVDRCLKVTRLQAVAGGVAVEDSRHRVLVYSGDSGQARVRLFGRLWATDPERNRIAIGKEPGRLVTYDAASGEPLGELRAGAPLLAVRFRADGRALLALTAKQEAVLAEIR